MTSLLAAEEECVSQDYGAPDEPSNSYQAFAGQTIRNIEYLGMDVFNPDNPKENNALYQFLNKLHITTKQSVIEARLLFKVGDPLDVEQVAETERILRSLPYLSFATIHLSKVCKDGVELLVVTRDIWTTEPIVNLSREGGDTKRGIGFNESNVLGRGSSLSLVFDKSAERSRTQYNFSTPHLFNTHLGVQVGFADTSDGQETAFALARPFYSLSSRWSAGLSNFDTTLVEKIRAADTQINAYKHAQERHQAFVGLGFQPDSVHRFIVGVSQDRDQYDVLESTKLGLPENTNYVYPWLQYIFLENRFGVYTNLDQLHRVEDVPLGVDFKAKLGYGGNLFGNDLDIAYLDTVYSDVVGLGKHHILKFDALLHAIHSPQDSDYSRGKWGGKVQYYYLDGDAHRYFAQLQYHQGHNLLQHDQLTAGGENGLRGYPLDYQRGAKRLLLSLESRYVTPWHVLNLFRVGAVGFVDAGHVWGAGFDHSKALANIGLGLRVNSSKAKLDHIVHLDLAYPLVDKSLVDEFQLIMKVESHF